MNVPLSQRLLNKKSALTFCLVIFSQISFAAPVSLTVTSELFYTPGDSVAVSEITLGNLFGQIFGATSSGENSLALTATYQYNTSTQSSISGSAAAGSIGTGYDNVATSLSLLINGVEVNANIGAINANASSAKSGILIDIDVNNTSLFAIANSEIGGPSIQDLQASNPNGDSIQSGNSALVVNDPPSPLQDIVGFNVGSTDIDDFGPAIGFSEGSLSVDSFFLAFLGNGVTDSGSLPDSATLLNSGLENSIMGIAFTIYDEESGESMALVLSGATTSASISPVPVPAAAWLFGSALIGLVGIKRKK